METGYSVSTELPAGYSPDFEFFIFGLPGHLALQSPDWTYYYLLKKSNQKVMAQVAFHVSSHIARSPVRAPFDSFHFSINLAPRILFDFIIQVERRLIKLGVSTIALTEPPLFYRNNGELLHAILLNLGYRVSNAELSTGLRIDKLSFEDKIEAWEKRRLKQAKQKGVVVKMLSLESLKEVYQLILKCREQRSHGLSMTLAELDTTAREFENMFVLSAAFLNKEMVAASIAIRVQRHILYNFYSGHLKKYDSVSPMVALLGGLYRYCERHQVHLLDLGTSSLHGLPNFSLLDFKLRLGGVASIKLSFEKQLS